MSTSAAARLAELTRPAYGVFTPRDAVSVGVSRSQVQRLKGRGEVELLLPGVYGLRAVPDTWERRAVAAQRSAGRYAVLSHASAARILGLTHLRLPRAPEIELTFPRKRRPVRVHVRSHESDILLPTDIVEVGCFRVTSPVFTIGALALRRAPVVIARALDALVAEQRIAGSDIHELTIRMWHTPGVVHLREAILLLTPGAEMTRSEVERLLLRICEQFGLPLPEVNVRVVDANGDVRYLDFLFREAGLAVEINAHPSHGTTLGVRLDGSRQNALADRFRFLNYDADDLVHRPEVVAKEIRRALDALGPHHEPS